MRPARFVWLLAAFLAVTTSLAMGPHEGPPLSPPFEKDLFPPHLVLENQVALGLDGEQVQAIKKLLVDTHAVVFDKQPDLQRAAEILTRAVQAHPVDEAAALRTAEQVMALEAVVKKAHLSLLIRIKNLLTDAQVAKLTEIRKKYESDAK